MEAGGFNNPKLGSDSQDSDDLPQPPAGTSGNERSLIKFTTKNTKPVKNVPPTSKGVEQAKKRLRAFSIQKKSSLSPVAVPKLITTGCATVFIGKAAGVKTQPKPEPDPATDPKKPPKPPKPGTKQPQESYINTQKKTLAEIEDMKRKMELVELGIPLGLICPPPNSDKAMPTKAMPPIKTFLDSDKVDELICEAKKARAEGKNFKFDYRKLLPDYANPFQRKKDVQDNKESFEVSKSDEHDHRRSRDRDKKRSDRIYEGRRHTSYKTDKDRLREERYKDRSNEKNENVKERDKSRDADSRSKDKDFKYKEKDAKSKDRDLKSKEKDKSKETDNKTEGSKKDLGKDDKEADVDLKDFVVCDSWSDNEDKSKESTPNLDDIKKKIEEQVKEKTSVSAIDPMEQLRESLNKNDTRAESQKPKLKKLNPVIDSFKFEIEDTEEDILDMFDEHSSIEKYSKVECKKEYNSPDMQIFDYDDSKEQTFDGMADDTFLESVINEIKQEEIDETSQDKGLVEYDESPSKDGEVRGSVTPEIDDKVRQLHSSRSDYSDGYKSTESGYKSTDSLKISAYKSDSDLERIVKERKRELERMVEERKIATYTVDSLETWSFVLKICQPLLFRHDRNKCYKETRVVPTLWYTENPKVCNCVKDRQVVYEELEMCKMDLVDNLYNKRQVCESPKLTARGWCPRVQQWAIGCVQASSEWETEDSQPARAVPPEPSGDLSLDKEYQRFMEAVWPEVAEPKSETPRTSPVRRDKKKSDDDLEGKKAKKMKVSEGWSQESDLEEEVDKSYNALQDFLYEALHYSPNSETAVKKVKSEKEKRKRKHSTSTSVTDSSESDVKKRKKIQKKKDSKKSKLKDAKRRRVSKKNIKKKQKQKKKKKIIEIDEDSDLQDWEKEKKKKDKKLKKKKQLKQKKKNQKKKKAKSSSSSDSSSDSEQERKSKKKKKNEKKKKYNKSFEAKEELFDVNILKNIKTERETDDERSKQLEFSPRRQKPREIINVKELQNDFVGNSIQIKKEVELDEQKLEESKKSAELETVEKHDESQESQTESVLEEKESQPSVEEQEESQSTPQLPPDESNHSQTSSQESVYSLKEQPIYEKDESHLRPSSQNSNYSFHDVMASGMYSKNMEHAKPQNIQRIENDMQSHQHVIQRHEHDSQTQEHDTRKHESDMQNRKHDMHSVEQEKQSREHERQSREHEMQSRKHEIQSREHEIQSREHEIQSQQHEIQRRDREMQSHQHEMQRREHEMQSQQHEMQSREHEIQSHDHDLDSHEYEQGNYEMYEQMAMAYQSDVASQRTTSPDGSGERRIETVVRARTCGEIKCDWRAGDGGAPPATPARPSRWGLKPGDVNIVLTGGEQYPIPNVAEPVYKIQSIANRTENSSTGYDEAYMDMYGASDKLQYGDCFSDERGPRTTITPHISSLDERIDFALRTTALGEVAKDLDESDDKDAPEKGILVTKSLNVAGRAAKRVSFADGYKPGQDSDVEEPPAKKRKKGRRLGCAWPCPATHADHVPLWDALPPPPPPPGSPPPPAPPAPPPARLLRRPRPATPPLLPPPHVAVKFDPNSMPAFMPPEPPPGLISFQNM